MAYGLVLVFAGVTEADYWAVNTALGIDKDGTGDWPAGLQFHSGGTVASGGFVVTEVWVDKPTQEAFMASRLGPALGQVGVPDPVQVIETEVFNTHSG